MALVTLPGGPIPWPWLPFHGLSQFSGNLALAAAGHQAAVIFRVPKSGTIDRVSFGTAFSLTGSPTAFAALKTVDASFNPTTTNYGGSTPSATSGVLVDNTAYELTFGTPATAAAGQVIAAVIEQVAGTALNLRRVGLDDNGTVGFPWSATFNGSVWTRDMAGALGIAIRYSDGDYFWTGANPAAPHLATYTFNSTTNPGDEQGARIPMPFSARVCGLWVMADLDGDADLVLYDGTTALRTISLATAQRANTGQGIFYDRFAESPAAYPTLTAAGDYRVVLKPTTVTNVVLYYDQYVSNAVLAGLPGGKDHHATFRTDAGAWVNGATEQMQRPLIGLLLEGL